MKTGKLVPLLGRRFGDIRGISIGKAGALGAAVSAAVFMANRLLGLELPEDVLAGATAFFLALAQLGIRRAQDRLSTG